MPGIPLLNLGTALGGLAGGWNQARSQGLQQALQQLMQQQYQDQSTGQALASLAAQAGLLNQPQTPLGQSFPSPQQPPTVNVANITPPASSSGGGAQPGYAPPLSPGGPPAPGDMTSADEVQLNADAGQDQFGATNQAISAAGFGNQTASSGGSDATPIPTPTPTPTPSATPTGSGGGTPSVSSVGIDMGNGQVIPMSTMFQQMDYQKLAQGIARIAPPGTSQADIYGAVIDLAKLAEGDKVQQQQAGLLMRAMLGGNFRLAEIDRQGQNQMNVANVRGQTSRDVAGMNIQGRENVAQMNNATRMAIANQSAQLKQAGMQARSAVQWTQIAQKNQQLAQQLNIAGQREAAQAISQQLRALQARIATFKPGPDGNFTDDQQKQLQAINDQIASIGAKVGAQQGAGP